MNRKRWRKQISVAALSKPPNLALALASHCDLSAKLFKIHHKHNDSHKQFESTIGTFTHCSHFGFPTKMGRSDGDNFVAKIGSRHIWQSAAIIKQLFQATNFIAREKEHVSSRKVALIQIVEALRVKRAAFLPSFVTASGSSISELKRPCRHQGRRTGQKQTWVVEQ